MNIWPNRRFCARDPQCWVPDPRYLYVSGRLGLENGDGRYFGSVAGVCEIMVNHSRRWPQLIGGSIQGPGDL